MSFNGSSSQFPGVLSVRSLEVFGRDVVVVMRFGDRPMEVSCNQWFDGGFSANLRFVSQSALEFPGTGRSFCIFHIWGEGINPLFVTAISFSGDVPFILCPWEVSFFFFVCVGRGRGGDSIQMIPLPDANPVSRLLPNLAHYSPKLPDVTASHVTSGFPLYFIWRRDKLRFIGTPLTGDGREAFVILKEIIRKRGNRGACIYVQLKGILAALLLSPLRILRCVILRAVGTLAFWLPQRGTRPLAMCIISSPAGTSSRRIVARVIVFTTMSMVVSASMVVFAVIIVVSVVLMVFMLIGSAFLPLSFSFLFALSSSDVGVEIHRNLLFRLLLERKIHSCENSDKFYIYDCTYARHFLELSAGDEAAI